MTPSTQPPGQSASVKYTATSPLLEAIRIAASPHIQRVVRRNGAGLANTRFVVIGSINPFLL